MAMPRSASAGASSRSATRFSAPSGSPAASARAAAVISESIANPVTLVTPAVRRLALNLPHGADRDRRDDGNHKETNTMRTR